MTTTSTGFCNECGDLKRWCTCPSSIRHATPTNKGFGKSSAAEPAPEPIPLLDQIRLWLPHIHPSSRAAFLAGTRVAEKFHEYGDGLFHIDDERLDYESLCEEADLFVFNVERRRRAVAKEKSAE